MGKNVAASCGENREGSAAARRHRNVPTTSLMENKYGEDKLKFPLSLNDF